MAKWYNNLIGETIELVRNGRVDTDEVCNRIGTRIELVQSSNSNQVENLGVNFDDYENSQVRNKKCCSIILMLKQINVEKSFK